MCSVYVWGRCDGSMCCADILAICHRRNTWTFHRECMNFLAVVKTPWTHEFFASEIRSSLPRARVRAHKRDRARSRMTGDLANLLRGNSYGVKILKYPHKILPISNKQISNFLCGSGDLADPDLQNKQDLISKILRSWSGDLVTGDLDQAKILRSGSGKISNSY
jgi:hypothetical protein